jgi:hypothetical protein
LNAMYPSSMRRMSGSRKVAAKTRTKRGATGQAGLT